ncbi:membrane associated rhomboid family serine protease [Nocardioides sp. BE266]|uniref:hypothetical protein n=1 Tax=Nocardioides sp. BE266 TaxID=2817725 RepID=UPI0028556043|nr:hypothetical protein [Nocardioides sp. BE266]MDR7254682.1 membrane associated rhomboid family serine protease [Nocardioides sp. BE266]
MRTRAALGALGGVLALYGAWLVLSRQDPGQWLEIALWLGAGVLAHDAVISGIVIGLGLLGTRVLPDPWRAPAAVALVVWGGLSIASIPVLTGLGVRPDNPTLLDRPYVATWWTISAIVVLTVVVAGLVRSRREHADDPRTEG